MGALLCAAASREFSPRRSNEKHTTHREEPEHRVAPTNRIEYTSNTPRVAPNLRSRFAHRKTNSRLRRRYSARTQSSRRANPNVIFNVAPVKTAIKRVFQSEPKRICCSSDDSDGHFEKRSSAAAQSALLEAYANVDVRAVRESDRAKCDDSSSNGRSSDATFAACWLRAFDALCVA